MSNHTIVSPLYLASRIGCEDKVPALSSEGGRFDPGLLQLVGKCAAPVRLCMIDGTKQGPLL